MIIEKFDITHFDRMEITENDHLRREYRPLYEAYALNGPAYTIFSGEGVPLACGGVCILRRGVGEIWMLPSKGIADHPVSAYRVGKYVIDKAFGPLALHRIQATVCIDDIPGRNYIEQFSFCFEGRLRKYGADEGDYLLYARVK